MDLLDVFFDWDVPNWSRSLELWDRYIPTKTVDCLEVGANCGGLSLMLAQKGHSVICSDLESPELKALKKHQTNNYSGTIEYKSLDITKMNFKNEFDIIIFKSVLGGAARNNNIVAAKTIAENLKLSLRPGGLILLVENNAGSVIGSVRKTVSKQLRHGDVRKDMSYAVTDGHYQS